MKKHSKAIIRRHQKKGELIKVSRQREQAKRKQQCSEAGRSVAYQMHRTLEHFFPELFKWMRDIEDCRSRCAYELAEIITACLAMFLFKTGARNELNNLRNDAHFCQNYQKLFKLQLPHPDTVNNVMKALPKAHLEVLKRRMIPALLNSAAPIPVSRMVCGGDRRYRGNEFQPPAL